jgi:hypothetical protein
MGLSSKEAGDTINGVGYHPKKMEVPLMGLSSGEDGGTIDGVNIQRR